ncbi:MAG: type III pantothenate kinase, partial [Chitinophagales bacterium]|nr:type III pantothenate kinase [Chitinophagales bacterium]
MQIVFDIGNTLQKCAVFDGDEIKVVLNQPAIVIADAKNILDQFPADHFILSSVTTINLDFKLWLENKMPGIILSHDTPLPIINKYATPETLGKDRLANAVGSASKFRGQNILSVDAGTCIKYDFVTADNQYLGGAISPGLSMRLRALHNYTAALPLIDRSMLEEEKNIPLTGSSTYESILSGAGYGALLEVQGVINAYSERYSAL